MVISSWLTFLNRKKKKKERESVSLYIAEFKNLSLNCGYLDIILKIILWEVFISGLRHKPMLNKIVEENDLSLDRIVDFSYLKDCRNQCRINFA